MVEVRPINKESGYHRFQGLFNLMGSDLRGENTVTIGFSVIGKFIPFTRRLAAERQAGRESFLVPADKAEQLLDEALLRLGSIRAGDPFWGKVSLGIGAAIRGILSPLAIP